MSDEKLISLSEEREARKAHADGDPHLQTKRFKSSCRHKRFFIDPETRDVNCKACEAIVDPFDALSTIARDWDNAYHWLEQARGERRHLLDDIDKLKRERKNLRAQVNRLKRKAGG